MNLYLPLSIAIFLCLLFYRIKNIFSKNEEIS